MPILPAAAAGLGKASLWGLTAGSGLWAADKISMMAGITDRGEGTQLRAIAARGDALARDPLREMRKQDMALEQQTPYIEALATQAELRNELAELVGARTQLLGQISMQNQLDLGYINNLIQEGLF